MAALSPATCIPTEPQVQPPPPTPEMTALSPATCIPTEPQVQPQTLLTCRNCQATFTSRNRLYKHLRFDCSFTTTKNAVKSTTFTSTTSSPSFLQSVDYVQQQSPDTSMICACVPSMSTPSQISSLRTSLSSRPLR
jgi:hypothetical protein